MNLKTVATVVGIVAGLLSAAYTCPNLYEKFRVKNRTGETRIILADQTPLISQTIEVHPDSAAMAVKVSVSYKIYDTGDILVESGKTRRLLPFELSFLQDPAGLLISNAYAEEQTANGARYNVKTMKYIESTRKLPNNTLEETKTYGDGTQEIKLVDPRSGDVLQNTQNKIKLSPQQKRQISQSKFNKMIYTKQTTTR